MMDILGIKIKSVLKDTLYKYKLKGRRADYDLSAQL